MTSPPGQPGFARRAIALHLLFGGLAIAGMLAGFVLVSWQASSDRVVQACLAKLPRAAAAVEMDYLSNRGEGAAGLLRQVRDECDLAYCALVGADGRFLAHTDPPLVGAPAAEPAGEKLRRGRIDGVRYQSDLGRIVNEYRTPLSVGGAPLGVLRMGVVEPTLAAIVSGTRDVAALLALPPLACLMVGGLLIRRLLRTPSAIDARLRAVASTPFGGRVTIDPVTEPGLSATGWNRLADQWAQHNSDSHGEPLEARVAGALQTRRGGRSRQVLQTLREGIAVTDAEGRLEFANASIATLLGVASDEVDRRVKLADALASRTSGGECLVQAPPAKPVVAELAAGEGDEQRYLRVERQALDGSAGESVWSVRDVTQQKLADRSRDQFIDAATHELRTPLANIKAYAETLATCQLDDPEQQKEFFNTINSEATRLSRFVDDLLDISSMEVGSLTIQRQNVEVERLLTEAVAKVKPLAERKGQVLELTAPPKLGEMHLDKDKVSALLVNLLGNAAKYTPGGGQIRVKVELGETSLIVAVSDNGVGIAADELPRVFDKFFRSDDPRVRGEVGTGLGLSLAREIARLHGGDVAAASRVGEGSTFTLTLPRSEKDRQ